MRNLSDDTEKITSEPYGSNSSTPDLPNIENDLTESTGVVTAKDPSKVKSEESSNNVKEYEF